MNESSFVATFSTALAWSLAMAFAIALLVAASTAFDSFLCWFSAMRYKRKQAKKGQPS